MGRDRTGRMPGKKQEIFPVLPGILLHTNRAPGAEKEQLPKCQ